ncbi:MAG: dipicolinate synthase subunit DpsA [Oscillospiraceae bacterium]
MVFAVIGGDERQVRLAVQLLRDGHEVRTFAMEVAALAPGIKHSDGAYEAVRGAECVVLPLPTSVKKGYLNAPLGSEAHCIGEILGAMEPGQLAACGMPDADTSAMARRRGVVLRDYYLREELLAENAVATAEGAIGVIMKETVETVWKKRVLIIGRGRIAKALAPRLKALGALVAVSARNAGDLAWIETDGFEALDTRALEGCLGGFDIVVNTVPSLVLGMQRLSELPQSALVIDLASKPGGVDFEAAQVLGIRTLWAQGLPGKWAPETAASAIRKAVYNILEEESIEGRT